MTEEFTPISGTEFAQELSSASGEAESGVHERVNRKANGSNGHISEPPQGFYESGLMQEPVEDRAPPHDLGAEAAVLSAVICGDAIEKVRSIVKPEHFFSEAHRWIFRACLELERPDALLIADWLRSSGRLSQVGGMAYLTEVLNAAPVAANANAYARIIFDHWVTREQLTVTHAMTAQAYSGRNLDALIDQLVELRHSRAHDDKCEVINGAMLAETLPPIRWLCEGLRLTTGSPTVVAGNAYSGKSLAMADLVLAVATGGKAWGKFQCQRGPVRILDYDGQGRRISQERLQRLARSRCVDLRALGDSIGYVRKPGFKLDDVGGSDRLCRVLDGIHLAVVDSWRGATPATDEWLRGPVQLVGEMLEDVSIKTGCTIIIVDHHVKPPREASKRSAMHDIHGTTAKAEMAQALFAFSGEEGMQFTRVKHLKERVTGRHAAAFGLRFDDVEEHGDPRWALRVTYGEHFDETDEEREERKKNEALAAAAKKELERDRLHTERERKAAEVRAASTAGRVEAAQRLAVERADKATSRFLETLAKTGKDEWISISDMRASFREICLGSREVDAAALRLRQEGRVEFQEGPRLSKLYRAISVNKLPHLITHQPSSPPRTPPALDPSGAGGSGGSLAREINPGGTGGTGGTGGSEEGSAERDADALESLSKGGRKALMADWTKQRRWEATSALDKRAFANDSPMDETTEKGKKR